MKEATNTVLEMGKIGLSGDIVPAQWFSKIRRESGSVHLEAIVILARICYWYRPSVIRDETTGAVARLERKFAADKLQMSYGQISEQFGISKDSAVFAVANLERLGLIKKEFRHIGINGKGYSNVLYIEPIPAAISSLTHTPPSASQQGDAPICQPVGIPSASQLAHHLPASKETYTEITTETSTESNMASNDAAPLQPETVDIIAGIPLAKPIPENPNTAVEKFRASTAAALQRGLARQLPGAVDVSWLGEHLRPLANEFCSVSGARPIKQDQSLWRKTLGEWYDLGFTPQTVREAYSKLMADQLTCSGPESITKTARSFVNAARAGVTGYSDIATTKIRA